MRVMPSDCPRRECPGWAWIVPQRRAAHREGSTRNHEGPTRPKRWQGYRHRHRRPRAARSDQVAMVTAAELAGSVRVFGIYLPMLLRSHRRPSLSPPLLDPPAVAAGDRGGGDSPQVTIVICQFIVVRVGRNRFRGWLSAVTIAATDISPACRVQGSSQICPARNVGNAPM